MAANCFRFALFSTLLFSRFSPSPSLTFFPSPPSSASLYSPQPASAPSASATLLSRGYSLMAGILDYASALGANHAGWNGSGTLFAPSDSAFRNRRKLPPYPTPSILLYHTARIPSLLLADITTMSTGSSLPTFSRRRRCVFLRQTPAGELCIAESPFRRSQPCVKMREPDLFHDGNLAIHGIDGVLDPSISSPCRFDAWRRAPHLDAAVTALRRKGYFTVAEALRVRRSELVRLPAITLFAPRGIVGDSDRFREVLSHHVVPRRYDLHDLARLSLGQKIQTIASSREIAVGYDAEGAITVDGISIEGDAIYRNRWVVILPVRRQIGGPDAPTPEESPLDLVRNPLESGGAALDPSSNYFPESSDVAPEKADDGDRSDKPPTTGVKSAVISPDAWCHGHVTSNERHFTPCTAKNTAPSVDDAATSLVSSDL